jgi:hypothetical protein
MIATRLSSVWQVFCVAAAALCCYLVSQSVAAERAGLGKVDREIQRAHDDIARLQTELGVRGREAQLESWNTQALSLKAARPVQYAVSGADLVARFARNGRPALPLDRNILDQQGDTTKVAYQPAPAAKPAPAPAAPAIEDESPAPAQPLLHTATYVRVKPQRLAPEAAPIVRAAYHPPVAASLLPADIADIAATERGGSASAAGRGKGSRAKADR